MKSVPSSYSLFASNYIIVLKVNLLSSLLLFGPSRSLTSNCIDGLLIEKINIILTACIERIEWYLLKIRLNVQGVPKVRSSTL